MGESEDFPTEYQTSVNNKQLVKLQMAKEKKRKKEENRE